MKLKLGTKINLMFVSILLVGSTILGIVLSVAIRGSIEEFAIDKVKTDSDLVYEYIDAAYPGDWDVRENQLYKGELLISGNDALVDLIAEKTDDSITFTIGDTTVATTNVENGSKATQQNLIPEQTTQVLKTNNAFYGSVDILDQTIQAAFIPLNDEAGHTVGVMYMGAPDTYISSLVGKIIKNFTTIIIIVLIIAIICLALFTRSIRKRLTNVVAVLKEAGKGDFTMSLQDSSSDELGDVATSYNQMTSNVKALMQDIKKHSTEVGITANSLVENAKETTTSTENAVQAITKIVENVDVQQQMIEQSAFAINDVTSNISTISENATSAVEASILSKEKAMDGQQSVENVVQQMAIINDANLETNEVIRELEVRSNEIGKIIDAITAISDQTNLLALNAAIESARAGEHGKGFAVVADEVRKLAEQSRTSANLISNIVEAIQQDTAKVSQLMQNTNDEIQQGIQVVRNSGAKFNEIYTSVEIANTQISELSAITEEMAASMEQINASFDEVSTLAISTSQDVRVISNVTDEQLQLAEKVMDVAQRLEQQSNQLNNGIKNFVI